jgi:APA family basic amino acid/polyamine antiporter
MGLKKNLNLTDLVLLGLSNIIGAGVFVILSKSILYGKSSTIYAFIFVAILSIVSGYTYSEISTRYKSNTAESDLLNEVYGPYTKNIGSVLIYLFAILSAATILINLSKYINQTYARIISILLVFLIGIINYTGIESSKIVFNSIGIIMIIYLATFIFSGPILPIKPPTFSMDPFLVSALFAIFLYNGYDAIVKVHDEVIDPANIPKAITISLVITTTVYILIMLIAQKSLSISQLTQTYTPLSDIFKKNLGQHAYNISFLIGLFIMFNTAFVSLLCGTRYMYGLAKTEDIPSIFAETNQFQAPHYSILISCLIMLLLCFTNNENLALNILNPYNPITLIPVIGFAILLFNFRKVSW